jgi:hypothetical protein
MRGKVLLAVLVVGCAVFPQLALAGTADQSQVFSDQLINVDSGASRAQTFTAGKTGTLYQVYLAFKKLGTPSAPLNIAILDTVGGAPGPTVLGSASVPESSVTAEAYALSVLVPFSVPVVAGTQYAIAAYTTAVAPTAYYWGGHAGDPYPRGSRFYAINSTATAPWGATPDGDMGFTTDVVPGGTSAVETGQRAAALKKCKKKHSHKAKKKCKKKAKKLPV